MRFRLKTHGLSEQEANSRLKSRILAANPW
jgi:hypothetical protein